MTPIPTQLSRSPFMVTLHLLGVQLGDARRTLVEENSNVHRLFRIQKADSLCVSTLLAGVHFDLIKVCN